jgi:hypothetical protein
MCVKEIIFIDMFYLICVVFDAICMRQSKAILLWRLSKGRAAAKFEGKGGCVALAKPRC